ncbi:MAG: Gfo/Idh/MocA family protein, partial [Armatimonadota bacterium]
MTNLALLGAGSHSSGNHGPALKYIKENNPHDVQLVAVCDLDEEKAHNYADRFGFEKTYQDVHTMLDEEDIDGLVLITPVEMTEKLATELLPEGIPLVIEKPPGVNSEAARRLVGVAE